MNCCERLLSRNLVPRDPPPPGRARQHCSVELHITQNIAQNLTRFGRIKGKILRSVLDRPEKKWKNKVMTWVVPRAIGMCCRKIEHCRRRPNDQLTDGVSVLQLLFVCWLVVCLRDDFDWWLSQVAQFYRTAVVLTRITYHVVEVYGALGFGGKWFYSWENDFVWMRCKLRLLLRVT